MRITSVALSLLLSLPTTSCCDDEGLCPVGPGLPDTSGPRETTTEPPPVDLTTGAGGCCDKFGPLPGVDGLCAFSEPPLCFDCDGKPALCMTHGCETPNAPDCCLSRAGETVACSPG